MRLHGLTVFLKGFLFGIVISLLLLSCATVPEKRKDAGSSVELPFLRMEPTECYFLDEFLPTPDSLVTGRAKGLYLRYYTFNTAVYKIWEKEKIFLAFFSKDNRCWSLFEEYRIQ